MFLLARLIWFAVLLLRNSNERTNECQLDKKVHQTRLHRSLCEQFVCSLTFQIDTWVVNIRVQFNVTATMLITAWRRLRHMSNTSPVTPQVTLPFLLSLFVLACESIDVVRVCVIMVYLNRFDGIVVGLSCVCMVRGLVVVEFHEVWFAFG